MPESPEMLFAPRRTVSFAAEDKISNIIPNTVTSTKPELQQSLSTISDLKDQFHISIAESKPWLEELEKEKSPEYCAFFNKKKHAEYNFLSNFYPHPVISQEHGTFQCSEGLYQY